jgi:hypothetical protein
MKRRVKFMDASESYDVVEQLDACIDMLYILAERTIRLGFKDLIEEGFNRGS